MSPRPALAASLAAACLLGAACGSDDDASGGGEGAATEAEALPPLKIEATEGQRGTELIVYVVEADANTRTAAGGKRKIQLRCFDKARAVIVSKAHPWPFSDTDNGLTDAHVHQRVSRTKATQINRCELGGTRGPLAGEVTSTGFE